MWPSVSVCGKLDQLDERIGDTLVSGDTIVHRQGETMLQLPCAPEGAGLHLLEVSRVTTRGDHAVGMKATACRRRRRGRHRPFVFSTTSSFSTPKEPSTSRA